MSGVGVSLIWCVLQVTLLTAAGAVIYLTVRRFSAAAGSLAAATKLVWIAGLTLWSLFPAPGWSPVVWSLAIGEGGAESVAERPAASAARPSTGTVGGGGVTAGISREMVDQPISYTEIFFDEFRRVARAQPEPARRPLLSAGAIVFLALALLGGSASLMAFGVSVWFAAGACRFATSNLRLW
jgi:hypothetical protein